VSGANVKPGESRVAEAKREPSAREAGEGADRANILIVDDRSDKLLVYRTLLDEL